MYMDFNSDSFHVLNGIAISSFLFRFNFDSSQSVTTHSKATTKKKLPNKTRIKKYIRFLSPIRAQLIHRLIITMLQSVNLEFGFDSFRYTNERYMQIY